MEKVQLIKDGRKIWIGDSLLYLVETQCGDYAVFDDGEYEGKYCGSLETLAEMTEDEAVSYIWNGI